MTITKEICEPYNSEIDKQWCWNVYTGVPENNPTMERSDNSMLDYPAW